MVTRNELNDPGDHDDQTQRVEAVFQDELPNDHRQSRSGAGDLKRATGRKPTTNPPTMPQMMPTAAAFSGGTPDAMAMPMHSGNATRKTTMEARKSCLNELTFSDIGLSFAKPAPPVTVGSDRAGNPAHGPGRRRIVLRQRDELTRRQFVGEHFAGFDLVHPTV